MFKKQGLARELADLVERPVKDYDPEANALPEESDQSSDDDGSDNEPLGTEHYVAVGKSKLRGNEPLSLGPQYRGARISREALEAEDDSENSEEEDEDEVGEEGEDDENEDEENTDDEAARDKFADLGIRTRRKDGAGIASDEERLENAVKPTTTKNKHAKRATAADFMVSDSDNEDEMDLSVDELDDDEEEEEEEEEDEDDYSGSSPEVAGFIDIEADEDDDDEASDDGSDDDDDEDEDEEEDGSEEDENERTGGRSKLDFRNGSGIAASIKEMMGEQGVVKSLLQTVDADVQKGRAVQRQRKGFDALLNIRIRLQKSLIATNSLNYADQDDDQTAEPYEAAEKSALQLWNALDDFRSNIQKGKKRKHTETEDSSTAVLWERMERHEKYQAARRKQVLEKWSRDAKKTNIASSSAQKFSRNTEKPITAVLSAEMDAPERLIKRTRTPRSCAPYQVAQKLNEDASIYDDADFYQLLLKELVDQRSGDGSGSGLQAATVRYAAVKEAKAKRHVDTKASKGRKMRFTAMPKLQNFMAPEDRRSWEQSAIDRFFGTLFGQKMALDEEDLSDEEMGGASVEDEGLRLFRS